MRSWFWTPPWTVAVPAAWSRVAPFMACRLISSPGVVENPP